MKNLMRIHAPSCGAPVMRTLAVCASAVLFLPAASAWTTTDANTIFNSFNNTFYVGNGGNAYFKNDTDGGRSWFWTQANMIEMVEDACDRTGNTGTRDMVTALCNGFSQYHGTDWTWNEYNDDVIWACITYSRAYLITGNTAYRDRAKANFDMVWNRSWSTSLGGGGIFWTSANSSKNACVNGPAVIAACYIYQATGNATYLTRAQQIYDWQRNTLFNQTTGAVADSISSSGSVNWSWLFSYNSGAFVGAGNFLYKITGNSQYYQDALLATKYMKDSMSNAEGRIYGAGAGDGDGFSGIGVRWVAKFVNEQRLWGQFYPWLKYNADLAWNVRRGDNLSWSSWGVQTPAGKLSSWQCFPSVTTLQVVPPNNPAAAFMLVNQNSGKSIELAGGSTTNGTVIQQATYDYNSVNQSWAVEPSEDGSYFILVNSGTGKALCTVGNSTASGAEMHSWTYNRNAGQKWEIIYSSEGWYKFKNVGSGLVLGVSGSSTADGAKLVQSADTGSAAQLFRLHPVGDYYLRTHAGKYLMVQGGGANGQAVAQKTKQDNSSFRWHFFGNGGGWERASANVNHNRAVSVVGGSQSAAAKLEFRDFDANFQAQKIRLQPLTNGKFKFVFKHSGMVWDIPGGTSAEDVQLEQHTSNSYNRQQFILERTY